MPDRSRCPGCGERVSPFAAGCAICGADLDTRRWDTGPGRLKRADSWLAGISFGPQRRVPPWAVLILILFGGTILGAIYAAISSLTG